MMTISRLLCLAATLTLLTGPAAAEIALYETGPAEDSSFLRFVNGSDADLTIHSDKADSTIALPVTQPASAFFAVRAGQALQGEIRQGGATLKTDTQVAPGEFVSIVTTRGTDGQPSVRTITETPEDFNALKASLAFYALDASCQQAQVRVAGRDTVLFSAAADNAAPPRRQINPVPLSVQLFCQDAAVGEALNLGRLQAGERYTIFLVPTQTADGSRIFSVTDAVAF